MGKIKGETEFRSGKPGNIYQEVAQLRKCYDCSGWEESNCDCAVPGCPLNPYSSYKGKKAKKAKKARD